MLMNLMVRSLHVELSYLFPCYQRPTFLSTS